MLDVDKEFDRLAWDYLTAVLQKLGIQTCMLNFIMALYAAPLGQSLCQWPLVKCLLHLQRDKTGMPSLPNVITLEPFLRHLRENDNIKGITIENHHYKVAAFADDVLLFLFKWHITLPHTRFSSISIRP